MSPPRHCGHAARLDDRDAERTAAVGFADAARMRNGAGRFRLDLGAGRPPGSALAPAATRHGIDLSEIRIHHDDAAASRLTEAHGADAVTVGRDIAFAPRRFRPGTTTGDELIEHELGHVAQQARSGVAVIQRDGPRGSGPGRRPPTEPFDVVDDGTLGTEDDHVRFANDAVTLPSGFDEQFRRLLAQHGGAVTVELHGYASDPGDGTYNVNLSAQRAAAVARIVQPMLPAGSVVRIIAHGATSGFGEDAADNRRVGIDLSDRIPVSAALGLPAPPPSAFGIPELTIDVRLLTPPTGTPPTAPATTTSATTTSATTTTPAVVPDLRPHVVFTPTPAQEVADQLFGPTAPPLLAPSPSVLGTLRWGPIHSDARGRGVLLGGADESFITWHYTTYFPLASAMYRHLPMVRWFFSSEADLANTFTRRAVNGALSGNPTPLEAFQLETDRLRQLQGLPTGVQTPSIGPTWEF
jgi:outer membrane protein OmpA-like peptidoglycan-associated protein